MYIYVWSTIQVNPDIPYKMSFEYFFLSSLKQAVTPVLIVHIASFSDL